jgi:hypothetical protein
MKNLAILGQVDLAKTPMSQILNRCVATIAWFRVVRILNRCVGLRGFPTDDLSTIGLLQKRVLELWHSAELIEFIHLGGNAEKKAFVIARREAEIAANKGEPDFLLSTSYLGRELGVKRQRAGIVRFALVKKGIYSETVPFNKEESRASRFCWELPTTIPMPSAPTDDPEDNDEESVF